MRWPEMKWTIGTKIGAGFTLVTAILLVVGAISYRTSSRQIDSDEWVTHTHKVLEELSGILQNLTDAETGQRGYAVTADPAYLEPYESGVDDVARNLKNVRELTVDNAIQQHRLDILEPMVQARRASLREVVELQRSKGPDAARTLVLAGKGKKEMDGIRQLIAEMKEEETGLLKKRSDDSHALANATRLVIVAGALAAFAVSTSVGFFIARSISRPLRDITSAAERMAAGDLGAELVQLSRDDEVGVLSRTFGTMTESLRKMTEVAGKIAEGDLRMTVVAKSDKDVLGHAFASMVENLRSMTGQIAESVNVLGSSANQISSSTTQLASSATETATAVSEATTTVEEVRQTAQLSAQKSRSVSESAALVAQISHTGAKSTEETIAGIDRIRRQMEIIAENMVRLSDQSQAVGQIVATVEDLATQSNILAVNASIEAARAGEQGRGFAVVAQEVRTLSEQSKRATDQVRNILGDIQKATSVAVMATEQGSKSVESGVKQAGEAGQSIQTLADSVSESAQAAAQIAASSQQQLVGVGQVAQAMENIKQASGQNMASARQLETAAHNLKQLGHQLKLTVEKYKV